MAEIVSTLSIRQLRGVLAVFDTGSLSAAAALIGRRPSTLSQQIAQAEALLRIRVFDRATTGLVPAPSGRVLEDAIRGPLLQLSCAILRASRGQSHAASDLSIAVRAGPAGSCVREYLDGLSLRKSREMMLHVSPLSLSAAAPEDGLLLEPGPLRTSDLIIRDCWALIGPPSAEIELPEFQTIWTSQAAAAAATLGQDAGRTGLPLERLDRLPRPLRSRLLIPSLAIPGWLRCSSEHKVLLQFDMASPLWGLSFVSTPTDAMRAIADQLKSGLEQRVGRPAIKSPRYQPAPRLEKEQLECVSAAARTGSITRAAASLGIAQPAATVRLKQSEQAVGRKLFERTPSGLRPLTVGAYLADMAGTFLDTLADLGEQLAALKEPRAEVRVGVVSALDDGSLLAEALARSTEAWSARFQDRKLVLIEARADELRRMVLSSLVEFAVLDNDAKQPGISLRPISIEPMCAVYSSRAVMPSTETVPLGELARFKLVLPSRRHGLRWSMEKAARATRVEFNPVAEIDSLAAIIRLVVDGDWITILPASAVRRTAQTGQLNTKPITGFLLDRCLCIARRNGKSLDNATLAFADLFQECLKATRREQ